MTALWNGGIIGGIVGKADWRKIMIGGISGRLTDKACRAFIAQSARGARLSDGGGLYLFITSPKNASWRIKYRINGKEKVYSIGTYPSISLAVARVELAQIKDSCTGK